MLTAEGVLNTRLAATVKFPVSAMVTFCQVVSDALLTLMGCSPLPERPVFSVPCVSRIDKSPARREFARGILFADNGVWKVRLAGSQGSGVLSSMSRANCFIVLPEDAGNVNEGDRVDVQPFDGLV
mgnify:CR=1 FL=1